MKVLLVVDVQKDFCEGGNLAVPDAEAIIPVIQKLVEYGGYDRIIASKNWHASNHQFLNKIYCVAGSRGAELHDGLKDLPFDYIQLKGTERDHYSYSSFSIEEGQEKDLTKYLQEQGFGNKGDKIYVCGLVTGVCVKASVLDARKLFPDVDVFCVEDASRGFTKEYTESAMKEMREAGVKIIDSVDINVPLNIKLQRKDGNSWTNSLGERNGRCRNG